MSVFSGQLNLKSEQGKVTYHEITEKVQALVKKSGIDNGICLVSSPHTTCSVIFEEYSYDKNFFGYELLQQDLNEFLESIFPDTKKEGQYNHPGPEHIRVGIEDFKGKISPEPYTMLNTEAHLKSSLMGASESFSVTNGQLDIGLVGYIYFIDWDKLRSRERTCNIKIVGE